MAKTTAPSILLIASDANLRLSLKAILEKNEYAVIIDECLCTQKQNLPAFDLLFVAVYTLNDVNLALIHLDKACCESIPVLFLSEPIFARRLQQIAHTCQQAELLIKPVEPGQIVKSAKTLLSAT